MSDFWENAYANVTYGEGLGDSDQFQIDMDQFAREVVIPEHRTGAGSAYGNPSQYAVTEGGLVPLEMSFYNGGD